MGSIKGAVAATFLTLSCALLCAFTYAAGATRAAVLDGRWTYNAARSKQVDPDLRITSTATETLLFDDGSGGMPYEFDLSGGTRSLPNGRTITWTPMAPGEWLVSRKKGEKELETAIVTLHEDTLTRAVHGKLPDGSPFERTVTYRRTGHGHDLVGQWHSIEVDTGSTWDGFVISTAPGGIVTWRIPTDLQTITGAFDGSDLPVVGPHGPTGETMAVSATGPGRFTYVKKTAGQISDRGTITVSPDHRWMTEVTWEANQPERKSRLVYERER